MQDGRKAWTMSMGRLIVCLFIEWDIGTRGVACRLGRTDSLFLSCGEGCWRGWGPVGRCRYGWYANSTEDAPRRMHSVGYTRMGRRKTGPDDPCKRGRSLF
jgi:hypothetical protein